jgi:hypothetical protein
VTHPAPSSRSASSSDGKVVHIDMLAAVDSLDILDLAVLDD